MTTALKKTVTTHFHVHGDPTHTLTLRSAFAAAMGRRFKELRKSVNIAIIDDDCFGLDKSGYIQVHQASGPGYRAFAFPRSADKMAAFSNWFDEKVNTGILEVHRGQQVGSAIENAWTNTYVKQGYERGIERGRRELIKAGYNVPPLEATGGIWAAFNSPMHLDRVGVLYTRTFTGLKNITAAMDKQISDVLGLGLAEGLGPRELARQLTRTIGSGLGMTIKYTDQFGRVLDRFIPAATRAKILARTEIIRAHHEGTIQEYENWRVEGVHVKAEWETAGDDRVCEECATLEGSIFTLEEIRPMIPVHPMCRCVALPIDKTKTKKVVSPHGTSREARVATPKVSLPITPLNLTPAEKFAEKHSIQYTATSQYEAKAVSGALRTTDAKTLEQLKWIGTDEQFGVWMKEGLAKGDKYALALEKNGLAGNISTVLASGDTAAVGATHMVDEFSVIVMRKTRSTAEGIAAYFEGVGEGYFSTEYSLKGILQHELGHLQLNRITNFIPKGATRTSFEIWNEAREVYFKSTGYNYMKLGEGISEYAAVNAREGFAEIIGMMKEGKTPPKWARDALREMGVIK